MRKLFALYTNEMIKISKKVSVIVILAIMVAIIFGFGGLMKYTDSMNAKNNNSSSDIQYQKEEINRQLQDAKIKTDEVRKQKTLAKGEELQQLQSEERSNQNQIDMLQYAIDKDISLYSNGYRGQATQRLFSYKETISQLSSIPTANLSEEQKQQLTEAQSNSSSLQGIIENKDYNAYISFLNNEINSNKDTSAEEKKIYLESNALRLKYNLTGEVDGKENTNGNANQYIYQIEQGKLSLLNDLDYTGNSQSVKPLTPELRQNIKNNIAVVEYKFEKDIINNNTVNYGGNDVKSFALSGMLGIGIFIVVILVMILAGGSVSSEISTGSIKSLIISPTKRWKMFTAKYLSLLTIGVIAALIAYIFSALANGIFFGFDSGVPYIYASNGVAHELNFYVYQLARLSTDFISVIVFMTFAFMLSIITRNTAASVAITIGIDFVGSTASQVLMHYTSGDWRKFIPFNNFDFSSKIFPSDELSQSFNNAYAVNNSLTFSTIYIAVLVICMLYIGLDSFNRRDIK